MNTAASEEDAWRRPSVATRWGVGVFLGVFTFCGVFGVELWPFTGWRLFADARSQRHIDWRATLQQPGEGEHALSFADPGLAGTPFLIGRLDEASADERNDACVAWLRASGAATGSRITVYRMDTDLAQRSGNRGMAPVQQAAYVCEAGAMVSLLSVGAGK